MENHAHRRPFNALGFNEVSKEWLWMDPGRRQNPTLRSRAGQKSVKAMGWNGPNERDRKKSRREGCPGSQWWSF